MFMHMEIEVNMETEVNKIVGLATSKESATSTNSKLPAKIKTDKWAPPKYSRITSKFPRPVGQRSLSQPSSSTELNSKSPRPRSVDNNHVIKPDSVKEDDKIDQDSEFYSTTILHMPEQLTKIDEKLNEDSKNNSVPTLESSASETKSNISGIPLRIKSSHANYKETFKSPRDNKRLNSTSRVSTASRVNTPKKDSRSSSLRTTTSNTLINQFEAKKKRLLVLKEEVTAKQHLVSDSYKILVELKKKLDRSGIGQVVLEDLNLETNTSVDPCLMENMKQTLCEIPRPLIDLCKELMHKRKLLVDTLDNFVHNKINTADAEKCLKTYKDDTNLIEKEMHCSYEGQQDLINHLIQKWSILSSNAGDASNILQQVEELQGKLKEQEHKLETVTHNLQQALEQSETFEKKTHQAEAAVIQLKDKIKILEHDLSIEKNASQSHKDKFLGNDQKLKTLKSKIQELESKCKESENKYNELQKSCKHAQDQIKSNEHRWLKEKEDLVTKSKHDKQMLDKLTKERSCFETRAKSAEAKLKEDLDEARKQVTEEKVKRETLQHKYDHIHEQLVEMEVRNKQALDVVNAKHTYEPKEAENISTEREVELYTELLATRVGLKAAEEKLQSYHREKLRFLDTIQLLQGEHTESITTIQNVQKITEMEEALTEKDEIIYKQKIEISSLNSEVEQLKLKEKSLSLDEKNDNEEESELKLMLIEGKTKIEQLIKKSSENEQRAIDFKHDLDKRNKQLYEMENLLKAREELLTIMKIKKDELQIENNSLNKYANEIRELLIQSREEARNRNELVQELTMNLETKGRACDQLEKMIRELEYSLSLTNEKRFKLQESIGAMEKELQSTKARIINMTPEAKTSRYGIVNSSRNISRQKSLGNKYFFTRAQKTTNPNTVLHSPVPLTTNNRPTTTNYPAYSYQNESKFSRDFTKSVSSNSSCDSENNLDGTAVRSWLNSYKNIEDIQKRLKFLKRASNSLSEKMMKQDLQLKQHPLQNYVTVKKPVEPMKMPSCSKPLLSSAVNCFSPMHKARHTYLTKSSSLYYTNADDSYYESLNYNGSSLKCSYPSDRLYKSAINVSCSPNGCSTVIPTKTPLPYLSFSGTEKIPPQSSLDIQDQRCKENIRLIQSSSKNLDSNSVNTSSTLSLSRRIPKTSKSYVVSSIPIPKRRYTPYTLPTESIPVKRIKLKKFNSNYMGKHECKKCSQIPIPKHTCPYLCNNVLDNSQKQINADNTCLCLTLNESDSDKHFNNCLNSQEISGDKPYPSRSYLLYTNSNISTYNNTKKHLEQIKSLTKTKYHPKCNINSMNRNFRSANFRSASHSSTSSENVINTPLFKADCNIPETNTLRPFSKYAGYESTSDSDRSNMSISTVIKCSHLVNNVSKNYSDFLISRKQYVLKLFTQNHETVHSESDITEYRDCAIPNNRRILENNITFAQSLNRFFHLPSDLE
ncbi:hypothetical protein RN001_003489 [Aquatica leii]|uniref:Uncharacterized protein n=1 Tax=Aquatica leii TaxID=1421715 RepID=A0AAN7SRL7_9COLE|nr:hypothetical protein RN001_003489 [Aquatica leii]